MPLKDHIDRLKLASELLKLDSVQSRVQSALATVTPQHRYHPSPVKAKRGSMKRFIVLDQEQRAKFITQDPDDAHDMAENRNRNVLDLKHVDPYRRQKLSSVLKMPVAGSRFEAPEPRQIPWHEPKPDEMTELLSEIRKEVQKLGLPEETATEVLHATCRVARAAGRSAALDMLIEIDLLLYTAVLDTMTGEIEHYENAQEAGGRSRELNESPDGMLMVCNCSHVHIGECGINGCQCTELQPEKPSGKYRYKTVKPEVN